MNSPTIKEGSLRRVEKGLKSNLLTGGIVTVIMVVLYLYHPLFLSFLDNKFYDLTVRSTSLSTTKTSGSPVIVVLDEKSLARYGQWPWPRYRIALLLSKLQQMNASSIGLDMVFQEDDRTSLAVLKRDIMRNLGIKLSMSNVPKILMDNDKMLGTVLAGGPFVLGYKFIFTDEKRVPGADCLLRPLTLHVIKDTKNSQDGHLLHQAYGAVCNINVLAENSVSSGFFNIIPDVDGVLRKIPLLASYNNAVYPSLALATLLRARKNANVFLKTGPGGIEYLRLDDTIIPLDTKGNLLIRYQGAGQSFDHISASDILTGVTLKKQIDGRIVFIGTSAAGLGELHNTPLDPIFPGVEVHATVVDNILKKEFFSRPAWIVVFELLLLICAGIVSVLILTWAGALWGLLFTGLLILGLWYISFWTIHSQGIFFSPILSIFSVGANFSLVTLMKYMRERREVRIKHKELLLTQDFAIQCLASLAETRDNETGCHILRTQRYVSSICRQLSLRPEWRSVLTYDVIEHICKCAPLHDIGKVGIPDHILCKTGELAPEELEVMKKHPLYGRDAIQRAEEKFGKGTSSEFLRLAKEMAYTHHEKWNGTGYPEHLRGEDIPLSGRIMALADMYDALVTQRVYKDTYTHEAAVATIVQLKGIVFDPNVVDAFLDVQEEFNRIHNELKDA